MAEKFAEPERKKEPHIHRPCSPEMEQYIGRIDYPKHVPFSNDMRSLEDVRDTLRMQKFFKHKYDPITYD
jgi:hypothetical protein